MVKDNICYEIILGWLKQFYNTRVSRNLKVNSRSNLSIFKGGKLTIDVIVDELPNVPSWLRKRENSKSDISRFPA